MLTFFQKSIHALSSIKKLSHFWERREVPIGFEPMKNGFAVLIDAFFYLSKGPYCFHLVAI